MTDTALAPRVVDAVAGPARLLMLPTDVRDVVSFRGSFSSAPDLAANDDVALSLLANVLDKGTRTRDRFAIAEALEGRGARLSFYADGLRMGFSGRALRDDLADVLAILAEQLRDPAIDPDEVAKAVVRAEAGVRRARESTGAQAGGAFARRLYGPAHPNYVLDPDVESRVVAGVTAERLRALHDGHVGPDRLTLAFVGDVPLEATEAAVAGAFGDWAPHGRAPVYEPTASPEPVGRTAVDMADRRNLDVRLGHPVALRRDSPDFLATYAAVYALGGNFSSRLMQTIRDDQGLTYGIGASLGAPSVDYEGHVRVHVTLSQETVERGTEAVRREVAAFVDDGVPEDVLGPVRTTLAGLHVVGLATTPGLAARLLVNAERGFDVETLDRHPDRVRALTPEAVTEALRAHVRPGDLHEAVAGSLPGPGAQGDPQIGAEAAV